MKESWLTIEDRYIMIPLQFRNYPTRTGINVDVNLIITSNDEISAEQEKLINAQLYRMFRNAGMSTDKNSEHMKSYVARTTWRSQSWKKLFIKITFRNVTEAEWLDEVTYRHFAGDLYILGMQELEVDLIRF